MKITTPEEFADRNAPRRAVVDMLCERIEHELAADRLVVSSECVADLNLRHSEISDAAERYRAVGWYVTTSSHAPDVVMLLVEPSRIRPRSTVPGSTLAAHVGSPDSAAPYREGKDR